MKTSLQKVSGYALLGEDLALAPVDIFIEDGIITGIEDNPRVPEVWICPALFNAHTHLGDMIAMDCGVSGDLAALVTPPDGLKHRLLRAATRAGSCQRDAGGNGGNDCNRDCRVRRFP